MGVAVYTVLRAAGAPFTTADEAAAFCAVQMGLVEAGAHFLRCGSLVGSLVAAFYVQDVERSLGLRREHDAPITDP